jgi:hypothetical protein
METLTAERLLALCYRAACDCLPPVDQEWQAQGLYRRLIAAYPADNALTPTGQYQVAVVLDILTDLYQEATRTSQ